MIIENLNCASLIVISVLLTIMLYSFIRMITEVVKNDALEARNRRKRDFEIAYNQGYLDGRCNHINDVENFVNEQDYLNDNEDKTFKQKSKWTKINKKH